MTSTPPGAEPLPQAPARMRTGSLRRRVILVVLALLTGLLLVLGLTTDTLLRERLRGQLEDRLVDRARTAEALADQVEPEVLVRRLEGDGISVRLTLTDGQEYHAGPLSPRGQATGGDQTPPAEPPGPPEPGGPGPEGPVGPPGPAGPGGIEQAGDLLELSRDLPDGAQITFLADVTDIDQTLTQVRIALLIGGLIVLALAALLLAPAIGKALQPLDTMTNLARSIAAGDRGRRLHPDRPGTEMGRTAAAFDAMLDTVEGAEARARDAETRLREFLSDAAHELRTPLTAIRAAADQLIRNPGTPAEREQLALTTVRETRHASRLVEDMLNMTRIDRGLDLAIADCDLHELARHVLASREPTSRGTRLHLGGGPAKAHADGARITQVLNNLVDNAIRAAGPNGTVTVKTTQDANTVQVDVIDDGPGVPAVDSERIFERFVRLDDARSRDHGGAGLGLPIARGIAGAHGGDLVRLPTDVGAHFRLTLPSAR